MGEPRDAPGMEELDERMMREALREARRCGDWGDVPVGAVVARAEEIVARAGNGRERFRDPTAHAEVLALREASGRRGGWRLDGFTLYVTLEPCAMCAGALVLARIDRLVYGAADAKAGFVGSLGDIARHEQLNHRVDVAGGVLAKACGDVLREFFRNRRGGDPGPAGAG